MGTGQMPSWENTLGQDGVVFVHSGCLTRLGSQASVKNPVLVEPYFLELGSWRGSWALWYHEMLTGDWECSPEGRVLT